MIDKKKLRVFLAKAFAKANVGSGKELVMILGPTGAGKSTSINYLIGNPLKAVKLKGKFKKVIELDKTVNFTHEAKIGHGSVTSETLTCAVFDVPKREYSLCDCPGFEGARGPEEHITAAVTNQLAIKSSKHIKALVITVDMRALISNAQRSVYLRTLLPAVESLLVDPAKHTKSIYFMFTKVDEPDCYDELIDHLQEVKKELETNLKQEFSQTKKQELVNQISAIELMLECRKNYLFMTPLDQGQSRSYALDRFAQSTPIPTNAFKFPEKDTTRIEVTQLLHSIAEVGKPMLNSIINDPDMIQKRRSGLEAKQKELQDIQAKIKQLDSDDVQHDNIDNLIAQFDKSIANKRAAIKDLTKKIDDLERENGQKQNELSRIDSSREVSYWQESFDENKTYGTLKRGIRKTKVFTYQGVQYARHTEHYRNGDAHVNKSEPANGKFQLTYTSHPDIYGMATVGVNIQLRHKPENASRIKTLKAEIQANKDKIKGYEGDIRKRRDELAETEKAKLEAIKAHAAGVLKIKQEKLKNLHHELNDIKKEIAAIKQELQLMLSSLYAAVKSLQAAVPDFEMLARILEHLPIEDDSGLLTEFGKLYARYAEDPKKFLKAAQELLNSDFASGFNLKMPAGSKPSSFAGAANFFQPGSATGFNINGLAMKPIPGDGHCLYRAASLYLGADVQVLRNQVADHLEAHSDEFKDFLQTATNQTVQDYITAVRHSNEWATHVEIEILMRVLDRPIIVVEPDGRIVDTTVVDRFKGDPIFVAYNTVNHYDALLLTNGIKPETIYNDLLNLDVNKTSQPAPGK